MNSRKAGSIPSFSFPNKSYKECHISRDVMGIIKFVDIKRSTQMLVLFIRGDFYLFQPVCDHGLCRFQGNRLL